MGDEIDAFQRLTEAQKREHLEVLRMVYGGGYVNARQLNEPCRNRFKRGGLCHDNHSNFDHNDSRGFARHPGQ